MILRLIFDYRYLTYYKLLNLYFFNRESKMSRQYSESRNNPRNSNSKNFYSELRQRDPSRDRSRDDSKSKHSHSSQKSSKSNRSGPVIFGGNAIIKKNDKVEEQSAEILSRP